MSTRSTFLGRLVVTRFRHHRQAGLGFSRGLVWLDLWRIGLQYRFRRLA